MASEALLPAEPPRYRGHAPRRTFRGRGIWSDGVGWATADLTPCPESRERLAADGRWHRTMGDALAYLDEADRLARSAWPMKQPLLDAVAAGDLAARSVLADACEQVGLAEVARAYRVP